MGRFCAEARRSSREGYTLAELVLPLIGFSLRFAGLAYGLAMSGLLAVFLYLTWPR